MDPIIEYLVNPEKEEKINDSMDNPETISRIITEK